MYNHYLFIDETDRNKDILANKGWDNVDFSESFEVTIPHMFKVGDIIRIDDLLNIDYKIMPHSTCYAIVKDVELNLYKEDGFIDGEIGLDVNVILDIEGE